MNLRDLILRRLRQRVDMIVLLDCYLGTKVYDVNEPPPIQLDPTGQIIYVSMN